MKAQCGICGNDKQRHNMCCAREITRLRKHAKSQSELIDKLEGQLSATKRVGRLPVVELHDPWYD